jgi:hypothetical protein
MTLRVIAAAASMGWTANSPEWQEGDDVGRAGCLIFSYFSTAEIAQAKTAVPTINLRHYGAAPDCSTVEARTGSPVGVAHDRGHPELFCSPWLC